MVQLGAALDAVGGTQPVLLVMRTVEVNRTRRCQACGAVRHTFWFGPHPRAADLAATRGMVGQEAIAVGLTS